MCAAPKFSVTIIYESVEAGLRAKRLTDRLIAEAVADGPSELNLWNFGVLGITEIRNTAASAAAMADMVIFSMSGAAPLPRPAMDWIRMWTWLIDGRKPAVVALFAARYPEAATIAAYLRRCTLPKDLALFPVMPQAAPDRQPAPGFLDGRRQQPDRADARRRRSMSSELMAVSSAIAS